MFEYKDIIYVILIVETALFALQMLTYKNVSSKSNRVIGVLMLLLSAYFSDIFFYNRQLYNIAIYGQYLVMPLFLSVNPLYYIYIKTLTVEKYKFHKKSLVNFLPAFFLLFLNLVFYTLLPMDNKLLLVSKGISGVATGDAMLKVNIYIDLLSVAIYYIQLIVYLVMMIKLLIRHSNNIKNYFSFQQNISLNWLKIFVVIIIINALIEIFIVFTSFSSLFSNMEYVYYGFLIFLINFLGYFGIKQTDIYYGRMNEGFVNKTIQLTAEISERDKTEGADQKIKSQIVSEEEQINLIINIKRVLEEKRLYLNPKLSIYDIAEELKTNISYVSFSINNVLGKNFRSYINEYRVQEAKRLLRDSQFSNLSIEGIAQNSGFTSMSTFRTSFLKYTDKNPSDFRKSV